MIRKHEFTNSTTVHIHVRPRWVFLYSGLATMSFGLLSMIRIIAGPFTVFGATFGIHTLLYASLLVVIGYQSVLFWVFCKTLNIAIGVLPPDPAFQRLHDHLTLERSLVFSCVLLAIGVGLGATATLNWGLSGFAELSPEHEMRLAIPSATCILLAVSTASMAFFLNFLRLAHRVAKHIK